MTGIDKQLMSPRVGSRREVRPNFRCHTRFGSNPARPGQLRLSVGNSPVRTAEHLDRDNGSAARIEVFRSRRRANLIGGANGR